MSWRDLYPFKEHFFSTRDGHQLHYVDEGQGIPIVMLHGNPTWSFFYRNVILSAVRQGYRALVPDHIGCGLSDKPQNWPYRLENHITNVLDWLESLQIREFVLVCHDWGGGIGMGVATRHPEWIRRIVLMNTAAYCSNDCPKRIALCRIPLLGALVIRGGNAFAGAAVHWAVAKKLSQEVKDGFLHPYGNWHDRIATLRFVQDIPLSTDAPSYKTLLEIEQKLPLLQNKDIRLLWGARDFCFHTGFLDRWRKIYPQAEWHLYPEAGHYLLEDAGEEIIPEILK